MPTLPAFVTTMLEPVVPPTHKEDVAIRAEDMMVFWPIRPENVEVAVEEVALKTGNWRPVYRVEVATPVAPAVPGVAVKFAMPWTERREPGVEVPMPTLPAFVTMRL